MYGMKTTKLNQSQFANALPIQRTSSFTALILLAFCVSALAAPPWSPPATLSKAAVNAESPSVAISDGGASAAAWARQQGSSFLVQASVNLNGTWTRGVNLAGGFEPAVAIDNSGVATTIWSGGNVVQSSTLLANGSWSPPLAISAVGTLVRDPNIVVDAAGNVTALWVRYDTNGAAGVETATRPVGGNWSTPLLLSAGAPDEFSLVVNAAGDVAAIWSSFVGNAAVVSSDRPFGGTWSAPYSVAPPAYRQGGATIGIDANGNLTAAWRTYTQIRVADKPAGGNWGAPVTLYTNNSVSDLPVMAKTASGDDMVAFVTYVFNGSGYNYQIRTSVRAAGAAWGASVLLTGKNEYDSQLHAGTTPGGSFVLTWVDSNRLNFKSSTRTATTAWSPFAVIANGGNFGTDLGVAGNKAVAIWLGGSFQATVSTLSVSP